MVRRRDWLIDKKIGSVIRMRRLKLGLTQADLGNALSVTFQQIQKYENGTNAVASTRISDLCRALEMTPNDLFGVSSKIGRRHVEAKFLDHENSVEIRGRIARHATGDRCHA